MFQAFGHDLDFEVREGAAGAKTVVCLHGLTGDRALLVDACEKRFADRGLRRVYLDLPGYGRSTANRDSASADHLVAALAGLIVTVSPEPPLVVGYSYGAYLALGLARDVDLVGLFLACPVIEPEIGRRNRPAKQVLERDADLAFESPHEQETFEEVAVLQTASMLAAYRRLVLPASRSTDRAFVDAVRARYLMSRPVWDALSRFARPTAIACGRHDHWVGFEDAARLARTLPDASLTVTARAGQLLPLEAPAQFAAALDEWLDRAIAR